MSERRRQPSPAAGAEACGFYGVRVLTGGRELVLRPEPGGGATIYYGKKSARDYEQSWSFDDARRAAVEMATDPRADRMTGFSRHWPSGSAGSGAA